MYQQAALTPLVGATNSSDSPKKRALSQLTPTQIDRHNTPKRVNYTQ